MITFMWIGVALMLIAIVGGLITLTRSWDLWDFTIMFWMVAWVTSFFVGLGLFVIYWIVRLVSGP